MVETMSLKALLAIMGLLLMLYIRYIEKEQELTEKEKDVIYNALSLYQIEINNSFTDFSKKEEKETNQIINEFLENLRV